MQLGHYSYVPRQFFIGFDDLFNLLESQPWKAEANTFGTYPPHNVIKIDEDNYTIEFAVAGFKAEDIDLEVMDSVLRITGGKKDEREYSHKGISSKNFFKTFTLADYVVVTGSTLEDGILSIHLKRELPESKKARKISIGKPQFLKG
jgi:molecular chaperone IbpA